jgi:flagellar basal-body rod modification protein FlgD
LINGITALGTNALGRYLQQEAADISAKGRGGARLNESETIFAAEGAENESSTQLSSESALADTEAFLTLLVAQIKNQNPLNPADGVEFLTQLAQFSQLEQQIGIRQDLQAIAETMDADGAEAGEES